jgi:hypothetical protein
MCVGFRFQVAVKREDIVHQVPLELLYVLPLPFTANELLPRLEEVIQRSYSLICMREFGDHKATPPPDALTTSRQNERRISDLV